MINEIEVNLGEKSIVYIHNKLVNGNKLARFVLNSINLHEGLVSVGLPTNANLNKIEDFKSGGILLPHASQKEEIIIHHDTYSATPIPRYFNYVVRNIATFLKTGTNRVCILENANAKPSDPALGYCKSLLWVNDDEVYHVIVGKDSSKANIKNTIIEAQSLWNFVGFLTSFPAGEQHFPQTKLLDAVLVILSKRVEKIIVGVYDGEGYLIWGKNDLTQTVKNV